MDKTLQLKNEFYDFTILLIILFLRVLHTPAAGRSSAYKSIPLKYLKFGFLACVGLEIKKKDKKENQFWSNPPNSAVRMLQVQMFKSTNGNAAG